MSQTETPVGPAGHEQDAPADHGRASAPSAASGYHPRSRGRRRVGSFVTGSIVCLLAVVLLSGGAWALWKDRVDRDASGFVTIGSATLRTNSYAIVGDLHGDGPSWIWESGVLGHSRVRATSNSNQQLFIGIAHTDDLFRYLRGAGYATINRFEVRADTTHAGGPPSGLPSEESIWAAFTQGTGRQTLRWNSRSGDWSIVFMNADAGADVALHGDASAKLPILPWLAGGLLVTAVALGLVGGLLVARAIRRKDETTSEASNESATPGVAVGASR